MVDMTGNRSRIRSGAWRNKEREMPNAVIENWDQFEAFLAAQPLCQWSAQKHREVAEGVHHDRKELPPKNDNAELAAALSSMA
jgi:hypothetical protein